MCLVQSGSLITNRFIDIVFTFSNKIIVSNQNNYIVYNLFIVRLKHTCQCSHYSFYQRYSY